MIVIDDIRSQAMGCYGSPITKSDGSSPTPNMDALAASGTCFLNHNVQWPVCGPSRASMLGGRRPDATGIYEIGNSHFITDPGNEAPTMTRYLNNNGYYVYILIPINLGGMIGIEE